MIHGIRKLAREIHRRSVWQVVGVYALGSWGLVAGVRALTDLLGLPSWTPTMTVVLLVMLLPLIVATAVVQEGIPGLRIEDEVDPNVLEGLSPDEVHVVPEAHPLYGTGLLTWRNTILGAVTSAALLVTSVVAYLLMWTFGIGPVGSLLARGLIEEGERVLVASFVNRTDDPSLGAVVADALELDLAESDILEIVGAEEVRAALDEMGLDTAALLTPSLAREVARAEDVAVVIQGDVARSGGGYRVSAEVVLPARDAVGARFDASASGDVELLVAIGTLAERVRERLGESLRSIRRGETLVGIGSQSEEALELYGSAGEAVGLGEHAEAVGLLRQAITIDPEFAMAWRKLAVVQEEVADTAGALDAYRRVVELWSRAETGGPRTVQTIRERIDALAGA